MRVVKLRVSGSIRMKGLHLPILGFHNYEVFGSSNWTNFWRLNFFMNTSIQNDKNVHAVTLMSTMIKALNHNYWIITGELDCLHCAPVVNLSSMRKTWELILVDCFMCVCVAVERVVPQGWCGSRVEEDEGRHMSACSLPCGRSQPLARHSSWVQIPYLHQGVTSGEFILIRTTKLTSIIHSSIFNIIYLMQHHHVTLFNIIRSSRSVNSSSKFNKIWHEQIVLWNEYGYIKSKKWWSYSPESDNRLIYWRFCCWSPWNFHSYWVKADHSNINEEHGFVRSSTQICISAFSSWNDRDDDCDIGSWKSQL